MSFESDYRDLIIKQYWDKPKARAEIELQASTWARTFDWLDSFVAEFDVDLATGDRLDIIGRIVGISRIVPFALEKIRFGFDGDDTALGFADAFDSSVISAPLFDIFENKYTTLQLDDFDYAFFIKAKIARNSASSYLSSDGRLSIQEAVNVLFDGNARVVDNKDMSLFLYVTNFVDAERLLLIKQLDLLPKPQGVRYRIVQLDADANSFGFADDEFALGFGDAFDSTVGGVFAEFIFID